MTLATVPESQMVKWMRNSDILTVSERGVTRIAATGTFAADSSFLIVRTNVKNIQSVVVGGVTLELGTDYDYDTDFLDTTIKTKITFVAAQTGAYTITYDYGADIIHADYPRDDLKLTSYPRVAVMLLADNSDAFGIGGTTFIENNLFSFVIWAENQDWIRARIRDIKSQLQQDAKNFVGFPFVKPSVRGPIIKSEGRNQVLLQGNIDAICMFSVTQV